jgi:hypothetical protein
LPSDNAGEQLTLRDALRVAAAALGSRILRQAADGFDRAAREQYGRIPPPTPVGNRLRQAVRLISVYGYLTRDTSFAPLRLIIQLAALAEAVAHLRETQQRGRAEPYRVMGVPSGRQMVTSTGSRLALMPYWARASTKIRPASTQEAAGAWSSATFHTHMPSRATIGASSGGEFMMLLVTASSSILIARLDVLPGCGLRVVVRGFGFFRPRDLGMGRCLVSCRAVPSWHRRRRR